MTLMDLFLLLQPCSIGKLGMHRVYFSGGWEYVFPGATLGEEKFFFSIICYFLSERRLAGTGIPCTDLQKTKKKQKAANKMKKSGGGQKEELPWVFFSKSVLFSYETMSKKGFTIAKMASLIRWTA